MKYLRKFESNDDELDIDYIKECFVDYLDNHSIFTVDEFNDGRKCIDVSILLPDVKYYNNNFIKISNSENYDLSDKIKEFEIYLNFYKEMEACIDKVKIQFPYVEVGTSNSGRYIYGDNGHTQEYLETHIEITFVLPKKRATEGLEKNKLNLVNSSNLKNTWI